MRSRALWWVAALLFGLVLSTPRVQAQRFDFDIIDPNPAPRAQGGMYNVRWKDNFFPNGIFNGSLFSITWYYATQKDGSDRKRMATVLRDDFGAFRQNWEPQGLPLDWDVRQDPADRRQFLRAPEQKAGPAISRDALPGDAVLSALIRPRGIQPQFSLGLRVGNGGRPGIEIQHAQGSVQVVQGGVVLATKPCFELAPSYWYWYEFGVLPKRNGDVEARIRVFDEKHQRVLVDLGPVRLKLAARGVARGGGLMAISGPADFAELFIDRWQARWGDDVQNKFNWDTSQVPNGSYYIIAEISDGKKPSFTRTSNFQVQVANFDQAARE